MEMSIADRIARWRGEEGDNETEFYIELLIEAEERLREQERQLREIAAHGCLDRDVPTIGDVRAHCVLLPPCVVCIARAAVANDRASVSKEPDRFTTDEYLRLKEWVKDQNRGPAGTVFTAGILRDAACAFEGALSGGGK